MNAEAGARRVFECYQRLGGFTSKFIIPYSIFLIQPVFIPISLFGIFLLNSAFQFLQINTALPTKLYTIL